MAHPLILLKLIGKGLSDACGVGLAGDALVEALPEVTARVWQWWSAERDPEQRRADLAAVAQAPAAEVRSQVADLVLELAADRTAAQQQALGQYLSLVPGQVRRSLRRPADLGGITVDHQLAPDRADDLLPLLPAKLPRFQPGERPLAGVDWELVELLGVGGFGEVWKAKNPHFDAVPPVALKFCLDSGMAQYLRNEAAVLDRVMRQGRHPGIVTLERTYLSAETPCLEYEYIAGGDLAGLIQQWHRGDRPTAAAITASFRDLAAIVAFAHSRATPIVHRDLKPANVLRQPTADGRWQLKVADFGIGAVATRQAMTQARASLAGQFMATALRGSCTPLYASPQQMRGEPADPRDDVHALGVIWYQMLTGDLTAGRPGGTRWRRRLAELGLDAGLIDLLGDCLEDSAEDRLADAGELTKRLDDVLPPAAAAAEPAQVARPATAVLSPREQGRQSEQDDLHRRVGALSAAIDGDRDRAALWAERGEANRRLGQHDQAVSDCTEAIRLDPSLAAAYATRGHAYRIKGQFDLAVADCTRAVELDRDNALAWYNRGEAHRLNGDLTRAIADCTEAIRLDPQHAPAWGARGVSHRQKGEWAQAIADLDEAVRLDPANAWSWAVRGEAHRLQGEFDRAIADCTEALRVQPGSALAYATRGAAFRQKGDFATAVADLQQALRLRPDYQWARDQQELARRRRR